MKKRYRVHRFNLRMTADQANLERFLNDLEGEVVAIIPNVTPVPATYVDFVLVVERLGQPMTETGPAPWGDTQELSPREEAI